MDRGQISSWVRQYPRWSPDGSQILMIHGTGLFAVQSDGSRIQRLVDASAPTFVGRSRFLPHGVSFAEISPDGARVVYAVCRNYEPDGNDPEISDCLIHHMVDGPPPPRPSHCREPVTLSLAYPFGEVQHELGGLYSSLNEFYEIAVLDLATGATERLFVGDMPTWSPEGDRIAFVSAYGPAVAGETAEPVREAVERSAPRLYTMAADGTQIRRQPLARTAGDPRWSSPIIQPPQWSVDWRLAYVVFERLEERGSRARPVLYVGSSGASGPTRIADTASGPSWSPDGKRLAFAQFDGDDMALYTIAADGTDLKRVTEIEFWVRYEFSDHFEVELFKVDLLQPTGRAFIDTAYRILPWIPTVAWSPDGSKILYTCGQAVCVVTPEGSPVSRAPIPGELAAWSPDGLRIASVTTGRGHSEFHDEVVVTLRTATADGSDQQVVAREMMGRALVPAQSGFEDLAVSQAACTAGFVIDEPQANPGLVRDCEVLLELRDALFGVPSANWGPGVPIDRWTGVTVAGAPPRVTELQLHNSAADQRFSNSPRYSRPTLPSAIGQLSQLRILRVDRRGSEFELTGSIPRELGQLVNLEVLDLGFNHLTGAIPPQLGQLSRLTHLYLYANQLTGAIPPEVGQLANLTSLNLSSNQLTGAIPPEVGQLANLTSLNLSSNQLTGAIPPEVGQLANLTSLGLAFNELTGAIPPELGQLAKLRVLNVRVNQLTGAIPAALGQLANLEVLDLVGNELTGPIPPALAQLVHLRVLNLRANQLTSCIPPALLRMQFEESDLDRLELPDCE